MKEIVRIEYDAKNGKHQVQDCEFGMFNTVKLGVATVPYPEAGFWFKAFHPGVKNVTVKAVQV